MKKEKQYGVELIRVISMGMIIGLHFFLNCSIPYLNSFSVNFCITWIGEAFCYVSVNLFILISGYFGVRSKETNYKRVFSLVLTTWFYSYFFLIIFIFFSKVISLKKINYSIFPLINGHYWFVTVYIMLMMFQPLINYFYSLLIIKKEYKWIILLVGLFCIIPTFFPLADANMKIVGGTNFLWFIIMYIIGGMIYTFEKNIDMISFKVKITFFSLASVIPVFVKIGVMYFWGINKGGAIFYHHNSFFIFIASIMLFLLLKNLKIKNNFIKKFLINIGATTFGVYLIHENIFVKEIVWSYIRNIQDLNSSFWSFFVILWIFCIYAGCFVLEFFRKNLFLYFDIEDKVYSVIFKLCNYLIRRMRKYEKI